MYQVLEVLMKQRNETQAMLSRATGIPQNTISNWKARNKGMSFANMLKIAQHYDLTVEEFVAMKEG